MNTLIAVPSKGRAEQFEKDTYSWLRYTKYPWVVFIEPGEYDDYIKVVQHPKFLITIPESNRGLGYLKIQVLKFCVSNGYDVVFKLDDDVQYWRDPSNRGLGHNAPKTSKEYKCKTLFDPIIDNSLKLFEEFPKVAGISLMYGQDMKVFSGDTWIGINNRLQSNYLVRTPFIAPPGSKIKMTFEDFNTYLNIRKKGFITVRYGLTGADLRPVGTNAGGWQSFDRRELANKAKKVLSELYPGLAWKRVENKNWDWEPDFRKTNFDKL